MAEPQSRTCARSQKLRRALGSGCADVETLVPIKPNRKGQLEWPSCFYLDRPMTNPQGCVVRAEVGRRGRGCHPCRTERPSTRTAVTAARKRSYHDHDAPRLAGWPTCVKPARFDRECPLCQRHVACCPPPSSCSLLVAGAVFLRYRSAGPTPPPVPARPIVAAIRAEPRSFNRFAAGDRSTVAPGHAPPRPAGAAQSADPGHRAGAGHQVDARPGRPDLHPHPPRGRGVLGRHAVHGRRRRLHLPGPLRPEGGGPARQQPAGERTAPRRQEGRRPHGGSDAAGPVWAGPAPPEQPAHPARAQAARRPRQGRVRQGVVDGDAAGRDHRPRPLCAPLLHAGRAHRAGPQPALRSARARRPARGRAPDAARSSRRRTPNGWPSRPASWTS